MNQGDVTGRVPWQASYSAIRNLELLVTKVSDRGTGQAVGVVADVGLFLDLLARELAETPPAQVQTAGTQ